MAPATIARRGWADSRGERDVCDRQSPDIFKGGTVCMSACHGHVLKSKFCRGSTGRRSWCRREALETYVVVMSTTIRGILSCVLL